MDTVLTIGIYVLMGFFWFSVIAIILVLLAFLIGIYDNIQWKRWGNPVAKSIRKIGKPEPKTPEEEEQLLRAVIEDQCMNVDYDPLSSGSVPYHVYGMLESDIERYFRLRFLLLHQVKEIVAGAIKSMKEINFQCSFVREVCAFAKETGDCSLPNKILESVSKLS